MLLTGNKRSEKIDFLRGLAILLVLFSHHFIWQPINEMGWIGVDLFFVLSGFLVSGLMFNEYLAYGNIRVRLFLIRRGFKIYPLFYFSIILTVVLLLFFPNSYLFIESKRLFLNHNGIAIGALIEIFFLQSYFFGFWGHHWSLSVEEMFYFFLAFLFYRISKKGRLADRSFFYKLSFGVFISCLMFRIIQNVLMPGNLSNYSAFHLRLDSLFAGVFISYNYYFQYEAFRRWYFKYRKLIQLSILPLISFTPFWNVLFSPFIKTVGFTMIYISFGFLLTIFLFEENLQERIQKVISRHIFKLVSVIGFYSYSIYLFHFYIVRYVVGEMYAQDMYIKGQYSYFNVLVSFLTYYVLSIVLGIGMSKAFEIPMLKLRDKYFPKRKI